MVSEKAEGSVESREKENPHQYAIGFHKVNDNNAGDNSEERTREVLHQGQDHDGLKEAAIHHVLGQFIVHNGKKECEPATCEVNA